MDPAPVALFTYNRPEHTRQALETLQANGLAAETDLFVFSDGPRDEAAKAGVAATRALLEKAVGFKSVTVTRRETNLGLANSIIAGVTEVVGSRGRIIVLEDDHVTSPHFLKYMNEALEHYEHEEKVVSIHAYTFPVVPALPESFFLRGADCWGWATWKRGWDLFEPDGRKLLDALRDRGLLKAFDRGAFRFVQMLKDQIAGKNNSWAIRWHASTFLADKLTLFPGRCLVQNIGHDAQGTHCRETEDFKVKLAESPVRIGTAPLREDRAAMKALEGYLADLQPAGRLSRVGDILKALLPGRRKGN